MQVHEEKNKGVYVKNLSDYYVGSAKEVYEIMRQGGQARIVSATSTCISHFVIGSSTTHHHTSSAMNRHERGEFTVSFDIPDHD